MVHLVLFGFFEFFFTKNPTKLLIPDSETFLEWKGRHLPKARSSKWEWKFCPRAFFHRREDDGVILAAFLCENSSALAMNRFLQRSASAQAQQCTQQWRLSLLLWVASTRGHSLSSAGQGLLPKNPQLPWFGLFLFILPFIWRFSSGICPFLSLPFLNKSFLCWSIISPIFPLDLFSSLEWTSVVYLKGNPALVNVRTDSLKDFFTEWHFLSYGHSNVHKMLITLAEKGFWGQKT